MSVIVNNSLRPLGILLIYTSLTGRYHNSKTTRDGSSEGAYTTAAVKHMIKCAPVRNSPEINPIQGMILRQLFTRGVLRFSEINVDHIPSDQFSYHLRQLSKYDLVEKLGDNTYTLSVNGRSRALLMDTRSNRFIEQGFTACRISLSRDRNGQREYLVQHRNRVPYAGRIAEPGGKILFGEDVAAAAKRNMLTETGLTCDLRVMGVAHFKDEYLGKIVQDKFFYVVLATNPSGTLLPTGETGDNIWMTRGQLAGDPLTHPGVLDMIDIAEGACFQFIEQTHVVDEY